jgi:general stress protein YciG
MRRTEMANTGNNNPGNFANDREKASQAGQKGGQSSGGRQQSNEGNRSATSGQGSGSGGNFAQDKEKASQAGRKGGESSGGGRK